MGYQLEKLRDEPIVIVNFDKDFSLSTDGKPCAEEILKLLDNLREPAYFIINLLLTSLSFDDVLGGANLAKRQFEIFQHPKMGERIVVTQSRMIEMASRGLNSDLFGRLKFRAFKNFDEALAYAREAASH